MTETLNASKLLEQVLLAIDLGGWRALVLSDRKPFKLRIFRGDEKGFDARVYIWNCTHGGGSARAANEYRVQLTSVVPSTVQGEATLLLGWHSGYQVFVGFDIRKHEGQSSQSPSIQVKQETLLGAHTHAFALYYRQNGEIAVSFRPELLVEYALNAISLHLTGAAAKDMSLLNDLDTLTETQVAVIANQDRKKIVSEIVRRYRAADFRKRVLGAYEHRCAMCGIQLDLIEAAHILPVAAQSSTDETKNGIALCKLHHAAYDRNLLSFDEKYRIEVSGTKVARLTSAKRADGLKDFKQQLRDAITLPLDRRDYPPAQYISESRRVRRWE